MIRGTAGRLQGAAAGPAAGGIIGTLTKAGATKEHRFRYAEGARRGLVSARIPNGDKTRLEPMLANHPSIANGARPCSNHPGPALTPRACRLPRGHPPRTQDLSCTVTGQNPPIQSRIPW